MTAIDRQQLNLWMHALVEMCAWRRSERSIRDRTVSPWDDPDRHPSHADRRKALAREILRKEFSRVANAWRLPRRIMTFTKHLITLGI